MEKNNQPLVSVVIPCYNHEQFVQDSIQSVIDQSYQNIELIIIDDGSSDSSVEKIKLMIAACEQRFTRFEFRTRPNKGLSATLNEAIDLCSGKYFAALASDDLINSEKTKIQVDFLENEADVVALFGGVEYINNNNECKGGVELENLEYYFNKIILNECHFFAPTQMIRIDALKKVGKYDPEILVEDWYMWLKLSQEGRIICRKGFFAKYRIHENNTTKKSKFIYENNIKTLLLYNDHPLYDKAYSKLRWTYIIWTGQVSRVESIKLLVDFVLEDPRVIFSRGFLRYCKFCFFKINNWF